MRPARADNHPMPYKPQSNDTSEEADRFLMDAYRRMSIAEKARRISELNRTVERLAVTGIRARHPEATEREVRLRLAALRYGQEFVLEAFGWDPEREGW